MGIKLSQYNLEVPDGNNVYLFNTYCGTSVLLSIEQIQFMKEIVGLVGSGDAGAGEWSAVIGFLMENGFVVPCETDELAMAINKYDRTVADTSSLSLVIAPSLRCNMRCYYCYEGKKTEASLHAKDIESLLAFISSRLTENGSLGITWFGGEPLLSKNFILEASKRLQDLCGRMGVRYAFRMVSNGYLLDAATAAELSGCGISSVQVTFDGSRHEHNQVRKSSLDHQPREPSFDRILDHIRSASEHLRIVARVNVSRINIDKMHTLVEQLDEASLQACISGIYFYPVFNYRPSDSSANYLPKKEIHFSMEEFALTERRLIDLVLNRGFKVFTPLIFEVGYLGCYASINNGFVIDYRGNIIKCDHELGMDRIARSTLSDFSDIDNDKNLRKWSLKRPESNNSCRACVFLPLCYSHCPHSNLILPDLEPRCPSYRYNWQDVFPVYLKERIRKDGWLGAS